jgi:imidazolonepropionase-like amidohydrolase
MRLVIRNVTVIDGTGRDPLERQDVIVEDARIEDVRPSGAAVRADENIDGEGHSLLPGLTDAHVHFGVQGSPPDLFGKAALTEYVLDVRDTIEQTLQEGFTTVRDAGGLEPIWARLVEERRVQGPRILPSGAFISQTGGHGDMRLSHEAAHEVISIPGLLAATEIVDGADAVRRAAREQLRRGATQIKLMVSGGVSSPVDPLESVQFTVEEIRAAVEVARSWGTYVLTHAHTSPAIANAIEAGVRSIEHASILDEATARAVKQAGAFIVPTLLVLNPPPAWRDRMPPLSPAMAAKAEVVRGASRSSLGLAHSFGIPLGSGSDLTGTDQRGRAWELVEKARELGPMGAIVSATRTNAELFGLAERIGTIEPGKEADLVLFRGDALDRIEAVTEPDGLALVVKGGSIVRRLPG